MKVLKGIQSCFVIDYPNGRWGFVGRVPADLMYAHKDGTACSEEELLELRRSSNPAMSMNQLKVKTLSWATKEEAVAAAEAIGVTPR